MSARQEIEKELREGERIEAVVFGPWGWGSPPDEGEDWIYGYGEPGDPFDSVSDGAPPHVPFELRGVKLSWKDAAPLMESWSFYGGYGAPACYATYIWTNQRVFWVTQHDGATGLDSMPRHPTDCMPNMPGG